MKAIRETVDEVKTGCVYPDTPLVLSLQGCMAVGKTTAVRYLQENASYIHISYEDTRAVIEEVRQRKLDKTCYPDYLEIQKLWLHNEVVRYHKAVQYPCSIMDFGAEEIEFYTLNYPQEHGCRLGSGKRPQGRVGGSPRLSAGPYSVSGRFGRSFASAQRK